MFIRKSTHDTVVRELNEGHRGEIAEAQAANDYQASVIAGLREDNTTLSNSHSCLDRVCKKYKAERDEARAALATANAELETLRAGKAKRVANLAAANKARAEAARARELDAA